MRLLGLEQTNLLKNGFRAVAARDVAFFDVFFLTE